MWNCETSTCPSNRNEFSSTLNTRQYTTTPNSLIDYQQEAVEACNPQEGIFRSGIVNMECGTGKTFVASELIRRSCGPCIVVAQHTLAATQFVTHLTATLGLRAALLQDESIRDFFVYDVVVTTYNRIVRVVSAVDEHRHCISNATFAASYSVGDKFLMHRMCAPFSLLILDEVHVVVADKFLCACRLRAHAIFGLSGSLVREDDRIASLSAVVGPVLYSYGNTNRVHRIHVRRVLMHDARVVAATSRTAVHQTIRALNPHKVQALMCILDEHRDKRVIVFSDTVRPTQLLHDTILRGRSLVLNGSVASREMRDEMIQVFSESPPGSLVLLCTKVCDVSIDFPLGCIVVQYHLTSGSRQQEVQRCGRGTRGSDGANVYHIVNEGTEEDRFSERRIEHLREEMWGTVDVDTVAVEEAVVSQDNLAPLDSLMQIKIADAPARNSTKRTLDGHFRGRKT